MELIKEQKFAILCRKMAIVDGAMSDAEMEKDVTVARANDLNVSAVVDAWNAENEDPHELMPVLKTVTDEDERDLIFFAVGRIAAADGILTVKEINRLLTLAEIWDWSSAYVVLKIVQMLRKFPELKVEKVD